MKQLVEYRMMDGSKILVEVDLPEAGLERVSRNDKIVEASQTFEEVLDQVKSVAETVISKLKSISDSPDELEVEFGIKLGAKAGIVIASADMEANYKVSLTWRRNDTNTSS